MPDEKKRLLKTVGITAALIALIVGGDFIRSFLSLRIHG